MASRRGACQGCQSSEELPCAFGEGISVVRSGAANTTTLYRSQDGARGVKKALAKKDEKARNESIVLLVLLLLLLLLLLVLLLPLLLLLVVLVKYGFSTSTKETRSPPGVDGEQTKGNWWPMGCFLPRSLGRSHACLMLSNPWFGCLGGHKHRTAPLGGAPYGIVRISKF